MANVYKRPKVKLTTCEHIWGWYYKIKAPALSSRTIEDVKRRGVLLTGNRKLDAELVDAFELQNKTIDQMVEYYRRGVPFSIVKVDDTKAIYDVVQEHLLAWKEALATMFNVRNAPLDDLVLMDQFATDIYAYARDVGGKRMLTQGVHTAYEGAQRINMSNFFDPKKLQRAGMGNVPGISSSNTQPPRMPDRDPLMDFFKTGISNVQNKEATEPKYNTAPTAGMFRNFDE